MSEAVQENKSSETSSTGDNDLFLELNFVPQWARRPPDSARFARFDDDKQESSRGGYRGDRSGGGARRDRGSRPQADGERRRERRPGERDQGPAPRGRGSDAPQPPISAPRTEEPGTESRAPHGAREENRGAFRPEPAEMLPLDVRFLPERKPLADLIRKVSSTNRAYPLLDLALLLMAQEGCTFVKLEVARDAKDISLFQCKICRTVGLDRERMESHVLEDHFDTLFDVQEESIDPPSGVFVCVAKCGLSGVLLGPPNHHSYAEAVKRLHAERFSSMDFEVYKRRIETLHNQEDVERWKTEASKRMTYRLKNVPEAEPMDWAGAQRYMRVEVLPTAMETVRRVILSEKEAHDVRDVAIKRTLRNEWQQESRFPIHLAFALRAAFRHRRLHLFKTGHGRGKGVNFVTAVSPIPLDPNVAIPEIRDALLHLREHPGCTRSEMVEALRPGADPESAEVKALLQPIHWLVQKGHIIEFFNGTLSVPLSSRH